MDLDLSKFDKSQFNFETHADPLYKYGKKTKSNKKNISQDRWKKPDPVKDPVIQECTVMPFLTENKCQNMYSTY
jgi:hypothetical protein